MTNNEPMTRYVQNAELDTLCQGDRVLVYLGSGYLCEENRSIEEQPHWLDGIIMFPPLFLGQGGDNERVGFTLDDWTRSRVVENYRPVPDNRLPTGSNPAYSPTNLTVDEVARKLSEVSAPGIAFQSDGYGVRIHGDAPTVAFLRGKYPSDQAPMIYKIS